MVVARFYTADKLPHLYWADDLARSDLGHVIPPAHDGFYPDRHPRVELLEHGATAPAALVDACPRCARWASANRDHILAGDEVGAR